MLHLSQQQKQLQKLSPAQIQYLKMLQLPIIALEQRIKDELELNPLLEEGGELEEDQDQIQEMVQELEVDDKPIEETGTEETTDEPVEIPVVQEKIKTQEEILGDPIEKEIREHQTDEHSWEEYFEESDVTGFQHWPDDDDDRDYPTPATVSLEEKLLDQLHMLNLEERLFILGEEIIGNIDDDGYLHRNLQDIVDDVSLASGVQYYPQESEGILKAIQHFDPVGIGARNLQECLLVQLEVLGNHSSARQHAIDILTKTYDHFVKKHFEMICKQLNITIDELKAAMEVIQHLNPKPGEGNITQSENYLTIDFFVTREDDDFVITMNDRNVPPLRISRAYRDLIMNKKRDGASVQARQFVKQKLESARWFIESINQRRQTMMKVMHSIVEKQRAYFENGPGHLKPLIYRDIASVISMDISTISRVVNGKYVQTDWGVHELRYFFSEGIPTATGEEVSNKEVKNIIRQIIEVEDPKIPLSDDRIMRILRERGYDIARRTVAKYREAEMIPIARLRKKI